MKNNKQIKGFSKLSKLGKIRWLVETFFKDPDSVVKELKSYWLSNEDQQKLLDGFSENTISNFPLPYGVAPNFVINGKTYAVPMVIEESSVVAAASSAAKFWMHRGGFQVEIIDMIKSGQVHFYWNIKEQLLRTHFENLKEKLILDTKSLTKNMESRGGGIVDIKLKSFHDEEENYFQLDVDFNTCDAMGANFINSILEQFSKSLVEWAATYPAFENEEHTCEIIMSILSNYTPNCLAVATVSCPVEDLQVITPAGDIGAIGMSKQEFAERFCRAVRIARIDVHRATTHNKGIFNGIDAVVLATGNDFRAIEACGHTHAARDGKYRGLTNCTVENGIFTFCLEIPLAVGTIGGLTSLHPMARRSLELLGHPSAAELMAIIAATGLAQNFAAVKSLITTGIQKGHMRLHLQNILHSMKANTDDINEAQIYFSDKVVSFSAVREFLDLKRKSLKKFS